MDEFDKLSDEIAEEMGLSQTMIDDRLTFLHFTPDDRRILQAHHEWFTTHADTVLARFFERDKQQRLLNHLPGSTHFEKRQQLAIKDTFLHIISGNFDIAHVKQCIRTGIVHQRRGVTPEKYISAYSWLFEETITLLSSLPPSAENLAGVVIALFKAFNFDMGLVLETYAHADHQALERMAKQDSLTQLPNYVVLFEFLHQRLETCGDTNKTYVFCLGVNRFKVVNETLGHSVGDIVLKEVTQRLSELISKNCLLSRIGGDIFVIVGNGSQIGSATDFFQRVTQKFEAPVDVEGISVTISLSAGVAVADQPGVDALSMIGEAEAAMYHSKSRQQPITIFEADMKKYSMTQLSLGAELRRAIDNDELILFYQPKVDASSGRIIGTEALIRWLHPIKGFMSPGLFIPFAEETVFIHPLTDWVIQNAIRQTADWQRQGLDIVTAVNISAANLQNVRLPQTVKELLDAYNLEPSKLTLEITESGLMADPKKANAVIHEFSRMGVNLSIDDFGTGYSSLAYLKDLPVNELKIDQAFIFTMCSEPKNDKIVRSTISLGHNLDLKVIAEGVEDRETWARLAEYGCDIIQGYIVSRPLPPDEFEVLFHETDSLSYA